MSEKQDVDYCDNAIKSKKKTPIYLFNAKKLVSLHFERKKQKNSHK